jgi:PIN domain nuclease of toxin-antitoxin system
MYLIDTCAFLWFLDDNPNLEQETLSAGAETYT